MLLENVSNLLGQSVIRHLIPMHLKRKPEFFYFFIPSRLWKSFITCPRTTSSKFLANERSLHQRFNGYKKNDFSTSNLLISGESLIVSSGFGNHSSWKQHVLSL